MTKEEFVNGMALGALAALGEGTLEPFGLSPFPPMPQPKVLRAILPVTVTIERS